MSMPSGLIDANFKRVGPGKLVGVTGKQFENSLSIMQLTFGLSIG
jgi:hypothetical protein